MQKLIDFVKSASISDTSMAVAYKMLMENVGQQEECLLLLFSAMYDTNRKLADEVLRLRRAKSSAILSP